MDMKLELVPVPVSDVDRAKAFYVDQIGFNADHDVRPGETVRIVQLTPPGSACSILLSTGLPGISQMPPGSVKALHLVVADIGKSRQELADRGVDVGEIDEHGQGVKSVRFSDPDGNSWLLQEIPWREW
ncbi:MAG TPA: VOC family protein [Pyrinomonadaceae bacterium]|jgi:catechol 2,3-dioxygenase-like lactoylglutathione lyase family enzyme|nr:VOC family protein [Pyrinomonadaceae bacterium]